MVIGLNAPQPAARLAPLYALKTSTGPKGAPTPTGGQFITDSAPHLTQNVVVTNPKQGLLLGLGITNGGLARGAPQSVYEDCTFDGTGLLNGNAAAIETAGTGTLTLLRTKLINMPRLAVDWGGGVFVGEDIYIGMWGQNPRDADHLEPFHIEGGDVTLTRFWIDGDSWSPWPVTRAGETGGFFVKAGAGPAKATLKDGLITGSATHKWPYPIQAKAQVADVDIYIGGMALERGSSGYIGIAELSGFKVRIHDLGGNFDLVTGKPIDLARSATTPLQTPQ